MFTSWDYYFILVSVPGSPSFQAQIDSCMTFDPERQAEGDLKFLADSKCSLCNSNNPTVLHILNACPTYLNQDRFTWQHDSVLQKLVRGILPVLSDDEKLYADLPTLQACDNPPITILNDIVATTARPDLVLVRGKQ